MNKREIKHFYLSKYSKKELEFIKYISKMYGVKLFLSNIRSTTFVNENLKMCPAYSISFKKEIYIDLKKIKSVQGLFTAFFHELQHCINYQEKKFINFHKKPKNLNDLKNKLALTLRAEIYTDKRAAKLQKLYVPEIPYIKSYENKRIKEIVRSENQITKLLIIINN